MKTVLSRITVALGAVAMALLAVPTTIGFGLICLVRAAVDRVTKRLE